MKVGSDDNEAVVEVVDILNDAVVAGTEDTAGVMSR